MSDQLALDLDGDEPNPNTHLFEEDGSPKRLLWCSDTARKGGPCPYTGERARYRPRGGCCKDLAARPLRTQLAVLPGSTFEDIFTAPRSAA